MSIYGKTDNYIIQYLGGKIQSLRIQRNLSQQELSEQTGLSRMSISKIENGENFTLASLIKIMRSLECLEEIDKLFAEHDNELQKLFE